MTLAHSVSRLAMLLASLSVAGAANAVVLSGSTGATVTDYSSTSLVAFDLDMRDFSTTTLSFLIEEADLLSPQLDFNAVVRNLSGVGLSHFTFRLQGLTYAAPGSVTPTFGTLGAVQVSNNAATLKFSAPELAEFHFGNPFGQSGFSDWRLDRLGLRAGDSFTITASVPEPSTLAMMLASLAMFSFAIRVRNKR